MQENSLGSSIQRDVEILASSFDSQKIGETTMKRFLIALALTCVLSGSALAGDVPTCGAPVPASSETTETTSPGDITNGDSTSPGDVDTCGLSVLLTILDLAF